MKKSPFAAYKQNRLQGLHEASPIRLISMLLEEAISCCATAAVACENGNIALKGEMIGKALSIIDSGLLDALDHEHGGEIANNLASVYQYCLAKLVSANIENNPAAMRECAGLLGQIRDGWRAAEEQDRR